MQTYFSEKFKALRKTRELTQEQIADTFHVSPQAVSRWETGASYPDIALLPHIAIFFKVTVDELLGTEAIQGAEKAATHIKDIRNLLNTGKLQEAIEAARNAVKEYPTNHDLQYLLLQALCVAASTKSNDSTNAYKNEILAMGEKIMNSADQNAYHAHKFQLIRQYTAWNMTVEAEKIVLSLPAEAYFTQDLTMQYVLEGDRLRDDLKLRIIRFTIMLCDFIKAYAYKTDMTPAQKAECIITAMQIENLTSPISGVDIDYVDSAFQNTNIAALYCEAGDTQNALSHIEKATDNAMKHKDYMYKTNDDGSNYLPWATPRNLCWILWEDKLTDSMFDFIRDDKRFISCLEQLKTNSHEVKNSN